MLASQKTECKEEVRWCVGHATALSALSRHSVGKGSLSHLWGMRSSEFESEPCLLAL